MAVVPKFRGSAKKDSPFMLVKISVFRVVGYASCVAGVLRYKSRAIVINLRIGVDIRHNTVGQTLNIIYASVIYIVWQIQAGESRA